MEHSQILLVVIGCGVVGVLVWFFTKLKRVQDEIKELIAQRFAGQEIRLRDKLALHMAQQSCGYSQKRGNGELILTDQELFFAMTLPKKIISIPLRAIGEIERPTRMCGQSIMKPLLKVNFTTDTGEHDAVAFHVKELDRWESEIKIRKT